MITQLIPMIITTPPPTTTTTTIIIIIRFFRDLLWKSIPEVNVLLSLLLGHQSLSAEVHRRNATVAAAGRPVSLLYSTADSLTWKHGRRNRLTKILKLCWCVDHCGVAPLSVCVKRQPVNFNIRVGNTQNARLAVCMQPYATRGFQKVDYRLVN